MQAKASRRLLPPKSRGPGWASHRNMTTATLGPDLVPSVCAGDADVITIIAWEAQRRKNRVWADAGWIDDMGQPFVPSRVTLAPGFSWACGWRLNPRPGPSAGAKGWQYTHRFEAAGAKYAPKESMGRGRRRRQWFRVQIRSNVAASDRPFGSGTYEWEIGCYFENQRLVPKNV